MGDWKYSADESATGALKNNAHWIRVKIKNTIRYLALAAVIVGFWHLFALFVGLPVWPFYVETLAAQFDVVTGFALIPYHLGVAIIGAIIVWFMP